MTDIAKAERNSCNSDGDGKESRSDGPAQALRPIEELFARRYIPADLKMHR